MLKKMAIKRDNMAAGYLVQDILAVNILDKQIECILKGRDVHYDMVLSEANKNSEDFIKDKFDDIILYKNNRVISQYQVKHRTVEIGIKEIEKECENLSDYKYKSEVEYRLIVIGKKIDMTAIKENYVELESRGIYSDSNLYRVNNNLILEIIPFSWFDLEAIDGRLDGNSNVLKSLDLLDQKEKYELFMLKEVENMRTNFKKHGRNVIVSNFYNNFIKEFKLEQYIKRLEQNIHIENIDYINRYDNIQDICTLLDSEDKVFICGSPGVGKSHLAQGLFMELKRKGVKVARYHFYLNGRNDLDKRLDKKVIVSNISNELNEEYEVDVLKINTDIKELIGVASPDTIFIFDGFDHVERESEGNITEIIQLLNEFQNFKTVIFSQPHEKLDGLDFFCYEVEGFTEEEATEFLKNTSLTELQKNKLIKKTDRNPLLLHYLKNNFFDEVPENLNEYYNQIFRNDEDFNAVLNVLLYSSVPIDSYDVQCVTGYKEKFLLSTMEGKKNLLSYKTFPIKSIGLFHESLKKYVNEVNLKKYEQEKIDSIKKNINIKLLESFIEYKNYKHILFSPFIATVYDYNIEYKFSLLEWQRNIPVALNLSLDLEKYFFYISEYLKKTGDLSGMYFLSHVRTMLVTMTDGFESYNWKYILNLVYSDGVDFAYNFLKYYIEMYNGREFSNNLDVNFILDDDIYKLLFILKENKKNLQFFFSKLDKGVKEEFEEIISIDKSEEYLDELIELNLDKMKNRDAIKNLRQNSFRSSYDEYLLKSKLSRRVDILELECDSFLREYIFGRINPENEYHNWLIKLFKLTKKESFDKNEWEKLVSRNKLIFNVCVNNIFRYRCNIIIAALLANENKFKIIKYIVEISKIQPTMRVDNLAYSIFRSLKYELFSTIDYKQNILTFDEKREYFKIRFPEFNLIHSSNIDNISYLLDKSSFFSEFNSYNSFDFETFIYDIGNWRDYQLEDLYLVGENKLRAKEYTAVFDIIQMLFYSTEIMDKSKDVWHYPIDLMEKLSEDNIIYAGLIAYSLYINNQYSVNAYDYNQLRFKIYKYLITKFNNDRFTYLVNLVNMLEKGDDSLLDLVIDEEEKNYLASIYSERKNVSKHNSSMLDDKAKFLNYEFANVNDIYHVFELLSKLELGYEKKLSEETLATVVNMLNNKKISLFDDKKTFEIDKGVFYNILGRDIDNLGLNDENYIEIGLLYYFDNKYYGREIYYLDKLKSINNELFIKKYLQYVKVNKCFIDGKFIIRYLISDNDELNNEITDSFFDRLTNLNLSPIEVSEELFIAVYMLLYFYNRIFDYPTNMTVESLAVILKLVDILELEINSIYNINTYQIIDYLVNNKIIEEEQIIEVFQFRKSFNEENMYNKQLEINKGEPNEYLEKMIIKKDEYGYLLTENQEQILKQYKLIIGRTGIIMNEKFQEGFKYKIITNFTYHKHSYQRHVHDSIEQMTVFICNK